MLHNFLSSQTSISSRDLKLLPLYAGCFAIYRLIVSNKILKPLSQFVPEKNRYKFVHRSFDCLHYFTSALLGTFAVLLQPYWHCPFYFVDCGKYIGCTGDEFMCNVLEKIYYFYFASYYLSDVLWLHTSPNGIKILIFHHIVTNVLTVWLALVARPALCFSVMILHDWVDIFLYSGKVCNYIGAKKASDVFMILFAVSFFYLRIFGCGTVIKVYMTENEEQPHHYILYQCVRVVSTFLYVCHLIWASQILAAIKKIFFEGDAIHDTRSDEGKKVKTN